MEATTRCPCGTGLTFGECCGPIHAGERDAPTAESLMRSRFTAFATGDETYLLHSWHPSSRPAHIGVEPSIRWLRLDIVETVAGGPFDRDGIVEFVAHYRSGDGPGRLRERSRFVRDRAWLYVDGEVAEHGVQP